MFTSFLWLISEIKGDLSLICNHDMEPKREHVCNVDLNLPYNEMPSPWRGKYGSETWEANIYEQMRQENSVAVLLCYVKIICSFHIFFIASKINKCKGNDNSSGLTPWTESLEQAKLLLQYYTRQLNAIPAFQFQKEVRGLRRVGQWTKQKLCCKTWCKN